MKPCIIEGPVGRVRVRRLKLEEDDETLGDAAPLLEKLKPGGVFNTPHPSPERLSTKSQAETSGKPFLRSKMVSTSLQERMGLKLPKPENLGLALLKRRGHARDGQPRGCHTE